MSDADVDEEEQTPDDLFRTAVVVEGGLGGLALLLGFLFGPDVRAFLPTAQQLPFVLGGLFLGVVATLPLLAFMAVLKRIDHPAVKELEELGDHPLFNLMLRLGPVELLVISLCAGVGEELLFRGWLMPMLDNRLHDVLATTGGATFLSMPESILPVDPNQPRAWWMFGGWAATAAGQPLADFTNWWSQSLGWPGTMALLISSVAFGFVHRITNLYVVVTGLMGFYFGLLLVLTGNLLVPITAHALYDAVQLWGAASEQKKGKQRERL